MKTEVKDLAYYKINAEEDYLQVPISVLRYISQLEQHKCYSEGQMRESFNGFKTGMSFEQWFEQFKK